jgi:hypothetical protein
LRLFARRALQIAPLWSGILPGLATTNTGFARDFVASVAFSGIGTPDALSVHRSVADGRDGLAAAVGRETPQETRP